MKITDILNEMTSAGAIATVAQPMGKMVRRNKKKKLKDDVQLDEYRATNILGFMSGLRKHPDVEKIVDIVSQADGQSALVRTKDGNAYEIQVRQAGMSQHPGIQKHTKKDKE